MAGNPNHPVVRQLDTEWHKLVAILMHDQGLAEFEITPEMIEAFASEREGHAVVADARGNRLVLRLVTAEEGERLARQEGGLPA